MTDNSGLDEIIMQRHIYDTNRPNHFCDSIERYCEKQEKEIKNMESCMTNKERIEELKDFLGNKLKVGDDIVINQNTRTGSSTFRKILKKATIIGFTKCQVITTEGRIYPNDVIKITAYQNTKAVEALEKVKEYVDKPFDSNGCFKTAGDILDYIDQVITEYGGKSE